MSTESTSISTDSPTQDGNTTSGATSTAGVEFTPITSQEALDKAIGPRLERERAKFADAVAKAAKFDELEAANKTELEKAQERAEAAEKVAAEASASAVRFKLATKYGLSDTDVDLFLTGLDEQTLEAQAKALAERVADRKKTGAVASREGASSPAQPDEERAAVRSLFNG